MVDYDGIPEDLLTTDWDQLLNDIPDELNDFFGPLHGLSTSPDSGCSLSIEDITQFLLNDDDGGCINVQADKDSSFGDVVLDAVALDLSPESGSNRSKDTPSPETLTGEEAKDEEKAVCGGDDALNEAENEAVEVVDDDEENDPAAKKRKRQMRNRDAAVRSRERKKMHVKDLEMKSKYFESECKRLGILLQCCMAENQALRLSLHCSKAYDASMARQESAVLLLELLLLGSLLGSLGMLSRLLLNLDQLAPVEEPARLEMARLEPRKNKGFWSMIGKTCKASRTRMKLRFLFIIVPSVG